MSNDKSDSIYRAPASDTRYAPKGDLLATFIGPKNTEYYLKRFENFKAGGGLVSWNWPAFFVATIWLLYRKMWLLALGYWLGLPIVLNIVRLILELYAGVPIASLVYAFSYLLIVFVIVPMFANGLYYRHAQKKIAKITSGNSSPEVQAALAERAGGTSHAGWIVAVFFVVFIVGILAAIAIPAYQDYTIRAQITEGLNLSGSAKTAVAERFATTGELPYDNEAAGLPPANRISGSYVSSVAIDGGYVVITYGNRANAVISGGTVIMSPSPMPNNDVVWTCGSQTIEPKYLPSSCR